MMKIRPSSIRSKIITSPHLRNPQRTRAAAAAATTTTLRNYASSSPSTPIYPHRPYFPTKRFQSTVAAETKTEEIRDENGFIKCDTLHELQVNTGRAYDSNPLFGTFRDGEYEWMTYGEFGKKVDLCRNVLKDIGIGEHSKVGVISNNRWEWAAVCCASYSLNASLVPMYEAQLPKDWEYILNDSQCNALFVATDSIYQKCMKEVIPVTPTVQSVLSFDGALGEPHAFSTAMNEQEKQESSCMITPPTPEDLANLIYTSGTTGVPKGVELLHSNFVSNIRSVPHMSSDPSKFIHPTDRSLAFLPWAHSYGQTCELWCLMFFGASMGISRGVPHLLEDLGFVKPRVLFAVPTLYKRIYDGVNNLMEGSNAVRRGLMRRALDLGRKKSDFEQFDGPALGGWEKMQYRVLDKVVLSKIRDRFGGNLACGFVAGAACPREVIDFMDSLGIPICEGYGLTETSPIIAMNTPEFRKPGSVGRVLSGVEVVIVGEDGKPVAEGEEGEVCCYGPNVMRGYWGKEKETDDVISLAPDGVSRLFHTGDLGKLGAGNWLSITGRLKEQYKLENGKYVCPTPIEEAIGLSRFISQIVLCGANRPSNVALIVPDWNSIASELNIEETATEAKLANDQRVKNLLDDEIQNYCEKANIKKFEVPTNWAFVAPFTAANNMLTPKMSIRRHVVINEYADVVDALYGDHNVTVASSADGGAHKDQKKAA